jgi:hypothetical protein
VSTPSGWLAVCLKWLTQRARYAGSGPQGGEVVLQEVVEEGRGAEGDEGNRDLSKMVLPNPVRLAQGPLALRTYNVYLSISLSGTAPCVHAGMRVALTRTCLTE